MYYIGCSFKFILKVGVAESIVNTPRISCLNVTSLFALFMFLPCRLTSCAFTIAAKIHWSSLFDTSNVNQVCINVSVHDNFKLFLSKIWHLHTRYLQSKFERMISCLPKFNLKY
jgi:hypothetical protein